MVKEDSILASIRGILRDIYNKCILGYNYFVRIYLVLDIELWGILEGLAIAIDRGFHRVFILSGSQEAVQVTQWSDSKVSMSTLVKRINILLANLAHWSILHVSKDLIIERLIV
ncbi:hypothetical protein J1N35_023260 [Gossypium stocksii]|uniref:RNase H type-1 domain-containing protein n=1 Tax=Gossypium stocksii TaxID=47602 RepID=A0A9D4A4A1_9ROSI|nr:hypothetical protein J1N35_023260 [Gossypium stocksii]